MKRFCGEILRHYREAHHLTQWQVANAIGTIGSQVMLWEQGKVQPTNEHLLALCAFFGCSVDDLLCETSPRRLK